MKTVRKRLLTGQPNTNIFTSEYSTTMRYGVLIQPTETHMGGVAYKCFKTKKECEEFEPKHANSPFEDFGKAKEFFNEYSGVGL